MTLQSIAAQPVNRRQLVEYVRPQGEGANQTSLRSLLAAAGFPAGEGGAALTEQVRRFQRAEIAAGRNLVHGADGKAGPETLNALRRFVQDRQANSENPAGLADAQANAFISPTPAARAQAPRAEEVLGGAPPGSARVGGDGDAARRALEAALRQRREAEVAPPTEAVGTPPPTAGENVRRAHRDRSELAQVRRELATLEREPPGQPGWSERVERLQSREDALTAAVAGNPESARFEQLERAQRELRDAQRILSGWGGAGRSRPEAERRVAAAEARVGALASELGYMP